MRKILILRGNALFFSEIFVGFSTISLIFFESSAFLRRELPLGRGGWGEGGGKGVGRLF
jgi:hypothetical protein